jgi:hypothetical protein
VKKGRIFPFLLQNSAILQYFASFFCWHVRKKWENGKIIIISLSFIILLSFLFVSTFHSMGMEENDIDWAVWMCSKRGNYLFFASFFLL